MAENRDMQHGRASARMPVSAHPAFPLIVGLWFAALLGLGTIVMPAIVLERVAALTGLTEPPLSAAARAACALLATLVGLGAGLALGRRVAGAQLDLRPPRRRTPKPARATAGLRPLSVHDDLGEEAIAPTRHDRPAPIPGRRRALAMIADEQPSEFLMAAPVPGEPSDPAPDPSVPEDAMSERPSDFEQPVPHETADDELDLSHMAQQPAEPAPPVPAYVPDLDTRKPRAAASAPVPAAPLDEPALQAPREPAPPIDGALEDLGIVQLAERLGRSLQLRLSAAAAQPECDPELRADAAPEAEPLAFSAPSLDHDDDGEHIDDGAALAVPPPVVPDALRAFMDPAPESRAPAAPEPFAAPEVPAPVVPHALRPFALDSETGGWVDSDADEDDDGFDPGPFTLPLASRAPDTAAFAAPHESDDEDDDDALAEDAGSFSSLLAMKNPFRPQEEFVRIDEPEGDADAIEPAVVFPGQDAAAGEAVAPQPAAEPAQPEAAAPPASERPFDAPHQPAPSTAPAQPRREADPAETERALRSALANLQRMSGAA